MKTIELIETMREAGFDDADILRAVEAAARREQKAEAEKAEARREAAREKKRRQRSRDVPACPDMSPDVPGDNRDTLSPDKEIPPDPPKKTNPSPKKTPPTGGKKKGSNPLEDDPELAELWSMWPQPGRRRSSVPKADKAWRAAKRQHGAEAVLAGARAFLASDDARRDGWAWVPGLHTWLNDQKYLAETGRRSEDRRRSAGIGERLDEMSLEGQRALVREYAETGRWRGVKFAPPDDPATRLKPDVLVEFGYAEGELFAEGGRP